MGWYLPALHATQVLAKVALKAALDVPARQSAQAVSAARTLYLPVGQAVHTVPPSSYVPAGQLPQVTTPAALNWPFAQSEQ